jgi:enoyl-CoA hydratase/carnithine racemase
MSVELHQPTGHPHVAEIVLNEPASLNALSSRTSARLEDVATRLGRDNDVRAVVLRSAVERAFGAGADLTERQGASDERLVEIRGLSQRATRALLDLPVPVLAAIHGYTLGGGLELALTADIIIADESAVLGLPETGVGIIPGGGGTALILERISYGRACELLFTGRRLNASEALDIGLVDTVSSLGTAYSTALDIAAAIAARAPQATRLAKAALRAARHRQHRAALDLEDAYWRQAAFSPEYREGLAAFAERRPPDWTP